MAVLQVSRDHAVPVGQAGQTVMVTVADGDTVYYGDRQVSAAANLGSLTVGQSVQVTVPQNWLLSASTSEVQVVGQAASGATGASSSTVYSGVTPLGLYQPQVSLPAGVALANSFDQERLTYNFTPGALRRFRAAMARAGQGGAHAHIVCAGHSIVRGWGGTSLATRWSAVLRNLVSAKLGAALVGTGVIPALDWVADAHTSRDSRLTGSSLTHDNGNSQAGPGIMGTNGYISSGGSVVFTPGRTDLDAFILYPYGNQFAAANSFTTQIDAAGAVTQNCQTLTGGTASGHYQTVAPIALTIAAGSAHTLTVAATANFGLMLGVEGRVNAGNGGVRISAFGNPGQLSAALADNGQGTASSLQLLGSNYFAPDLLIIECLINDYYGNVTPAAYLANIQSVVQQVRSVGNTDIMLLTDFPVQTPTGQNNLQSSFNQQLYSLADTFGIALIDLHEMFNTWAQMVAPPYNEAAVGLGDHPSNIGHYHIGMHVYSALASLGVGL